MVKILTIILIILININIIGCSSMDFVPKGAKLPTKGAPEFIKGSEDGCKTGLGARGTSFYRTIFKFSLDPKLVTNDVYYAIYFRSYIYCFHFANKWGTPLSILGVTMDSKWWDNGGVHASIPQINKLNLQGIKWPWEYHAPTANIFGGAGNWWNNMFKNNGSKGLFMKAQ